MPSNFLSKGSHSKHFKIVDHMISMEIFQLYHGNGKAVIGSTQRNELIALQ